MLTDRIMGAFQFRSGIYREVEEDATFTQSAWLIVVVVSFLNQLGNYARAPEGESLQVGNWLVSAIVGTIFAVVGFAIAAFIVNWAGRTFFNAEVTFDEVVRTMGLAYVWQVVGVIGALAAFSTALSCVLAPALLVAGILGIVAWFIAVKEALDLDWAPTIGVVILAVVCFMIFVFVIAVAVLGALGITVGAAVLALG